MKDLEVAGSELQTDTLDHHGVVAGACRFLDLENRIDKRIGSEDPRRKIQPGLAVCAMILNGLGFTNRRLYLTPQFFENKALDRFFSRTVSAKELDDHTLGKALDDISNYGASRLFGEVAFDIALEHGLLNGHAHLDSTSFSLTGAYESEEPQAIEVSHGYSKDHRPDLKQVMLSLVMSGDGNIPIWMTPNNGNTSDKKEFHETIDAVRNYQSQMHETMRETMRETMQKKRQEKSAYVK